MAVIHDVIPAFELFQPTSVDDALALQARHGAKAWVLAGGLDSFDWFKDRIKRPEVVIDLSQVRELRGVRAAGDGLEIGAMTTLTEVVRHPMIREKFGILPNAAEAAASPQIRNQGTIGGNVSQDARCWYYRGGWPCYRAGGNICYADTPTGLNREHAILDANRCVAVNPSDTAPALIALDAKFVIRTPKGERVVDAENYFIGPGTDITKMTILQPGDLLTTIRIPSTWAGSQFYFEKVRDRAVWDFALVNVAAAMVMSGSTIQRIRLAVNGVAAHPVRLTAVEAAVVGKPRNEETAEMAGQLAIQGAEPLQYNGYKVPLLRNLVKRAIRRHGGVGGELEPHSVGAKSVGTAGAHPYFLDALVGFRNRGVAVSDRPCALCEHLGQARACGGLLRRFQRGCGANSRARSPAQSQRAAVSRDHGAGHACLAVHRVSPQSGRRVSVGYLSLDRGNRSFDFRPLSHF